jgi:hypothetical protein
MSRNNPLWGTERIRGELLKLAIVVSNRSIRRYRWRSPRRERSQSWRTFLRNQIKGIWAADLFVVQTIGFQTLYVFFFISHERRELIHCNVTASPTAAWIWRQVIEVTAWGRRPQHLIHDATTLTAVTSEASWPVLASRTSKRPTGRRWRTRSQSGWFGPYAKSALTTSSC